MRQQEVTPGGVLLPQNSLVEKTTHVIAFRSQKPSVLFGNCSVTRGLGGGGGGGGERVASF